MLLSCFCNFSCSNENEPPSDLIGKWYGTRRYYNPVGGNKYQYITVELKADKTGSLEYEAPNSFSAASFKWKKSGNQIICEGASASSNGDVSDFFMKMQISGERLIPIDRYNLFILTKDNSVITDGDGNEI